MTIINTVGAFLTGLKRGEFG